MTKSCKTSLPFPPVRHQRRTFMGFLLLKNIIYAHFIAAIKAELFQSVNHKQFFADLEYHA